MKRRHHHHSPEERGEDGLGVKKEQPPQGAWRWICSAGALLMLETSPGLLCIAGQAASLGLLHFPSSFPPFDQYGGDPG